MLQNPNDNFVVRFFQLSLSLRNMSLDPNDGMSSRVSSTVSRFWRMLNVLMVCVSLLAGMLPPACQRSIFVLSTSMLMFAAKIYHVLGLSDLLKSLVLNDVSCICSISMFVWELVVWGLG